MRYFLLSFLLVFVLAGQASAQEDFVVIPDQGTYTIKASWDAEYNEVCFFDVGTALDLMCVSTPEADLHPDTGEQYCQIQVTVVNPGFDVDIRAYAKDVSGNRSADSPNKATADFTAPPEPHILR